MNKKIIPTIVALCAIPHLATTQTTTQGSTPGILVKPQVARTADNPLKLGFNAPWIAFQGGSLADSTHWNSTTMSVKPDLVTFLKRDFGGALYRYPGGTPGNLFEWTKAIGPIANRAAMKWYSIESSASEKAYFGINEFFSFVSQVNGTPMLQLNMVTNNGSWVQSNADWTERKKQDLAFFEYVNAPVNEDWNGDGAYQGQLRAQHRGIPTPYGVQIWELSNETDAYDKYSGNPVYAGYTPELYASRCAELVAIMRSKPGGDKLTIIVHGRTNPWGFTASNPETEHYSVWNNAVMSNLPASLTPVNGIAIHPYYSGISVEWAGAFVNQFRALTTSNPDVFVTEHAVWPNLDSQPSWGNTTSLKSTVDVADFILEEAPKPFVKMAINHSLGSAGPWQPFNALNPVTGGYSTSPAFSPRPMAHGLRLLHKCFDQATVHQTDVVTPFTTMTGTTPNTYDIRAVGFSYAGTPVHGAAWVNRSTSRRDTALSVPGWTTGNKILRVDGLGGAGAAELPWQTYHSCLVTSGSGLVRLPDLSMGAVTVIGDDLVLNGSFETSAAKWDSRNQATTGTVTQIGNDPVGSFSGTGFLRVTKTSGTGTHVAVQPNWRNANLGNSGTLRANPHDAYVLRANVRTTNCAANSVSLKVQIFQEAGSVRSQASAFAPADTAGQWKGLSLDFIPTTVMQNPAGLLTNAELMLQNSSSNGYADFDSVTLQRRPNTLTNGALQAGSTSPTDWSVRGGTATHQRLTQPYYTTLGVASAANPIQFVQNIQSPTQFTVRRSEMWRLRAKVRHTNLDATGATLKIQLFSNTEFLGALSSSTAKVTGSSTGWVDVLFEFCPRDFARVNEIKRIEPMIQMGSATGSIDICAVNLEILD